MTPLEELAAKLRTFWLRDISASSASVDGSAAADGSVALSRTLFVPAAGGLVGINQIPTDPYALDVVGHGRIAGNLYARAGNAWNIGADGAPWGAIYASELHVGNLIAENKIATTGGRILVSPSTKVILAMTTGATTIDVAANTLTSGDRIYLESTGKLEWMAVTSGSTAVTGGYRYSVTRNLNGAGAQTWAAGDAVVNTGQSGQGFIDLYSRYGIPANGQTSTTRQGPTIVGNVRTGSTFDAIKERWAVGNLNGLYDYAVTAYGLAAGDPTAAWFALDASNGLRMMQASTARVQLTAAGVFAINDSDGHAVFTFNASAGAEFTLPLTLGTNGGIYQGTGTFASPTTGLKIFNSGGVGKIAGYNTGVVQWYADTDGKLYAGAGAAVLDVSGVTVTANNGATAEVSAYKFSPKSHAGGSWGMYGYYGATTQTLGLIALTDTTKSSSIILNATAGAGRGAQIDLYAGGGTGVAEVLVSGPDATVFITGKLSAAADATYDVGESTIRRFRDAYLSRSLYAASLKLLGATSGTAIITPPAVAGTPTLTLPTSTGTLALTSDVTTAVSGTSGTIAKFTGTNVVGNSVITESGAAISVAGAAALVGQSNTNQFILKGYSTQTSPQILIQSSAAAELARIYVNATYSIAIGYQAGAALGASTGSVLIGYQAGNALTTNDMVAIGYQAGYSATAARNVFIGKNAGRLTVGGDYNVAIGEGALATNVSGQSSFALGYGALGVATASENVAIGASALQKCTTGYYNVGIGTLALGELLGATGNLGIGQSALRNLVSGTDNTAVGTSAGYSSTGSNNVLLGHTAGGSCTGSNNVIIGYHAGRYTGATSAFGECVYIGTLAGGGTGNYCVGVGRETLTANVTAATAVGYQAGKVATGAGSVFLGYQAGLTVSSGTNNTILGYQAGASLTTNGGCVMIGYQAGGSETAANKLYIHNSNSATPLIYGDFSTPSLTFNGLVTHADGYNVAFGTTTGSKIGTATSQKLGLWNATPIVQPTTAVAAATFTANSGTAVNDASTFDGYTLGQVVKALRNMGALA